MALSNLTKVQTLGIGSNIEVVGVITTGQFKSGTSNLHSTGVELTNLNVSGIATIGGSISIGGTLTYQDVTNIDSVGIITARSNIDCNGDLDVDGHTELDNLRVSGIATVQDDLHLPDASQLLMGDNNEFKIYHNESNSLNYIQAANNAPLLLRSSNADMIHCSPQGAVQLKHDGSTKIQTTNTGAVISGICTATSFSGDGSNLTGISGVTVSGQSDNRVITATSTTDTLQSEPNFLHDATNCDTTIQGYEALKVIDLIVKNTNNHGNAAGARITIESGSSANTGPQFGMICGSHSWYLQVPKAAGNLEFNNNNTGTNFLMADDGDFHITDGDLVLAAGHGIDFSSTGQGGSSSSMQNELLDDYEEGVWVPVAHGFTASGTYHANYTKIGRLVHITMWVQTASGSSGSPFYISGLPYTVRGGTNCYQYACGRLGSGGHTNSASDIVFEFTPNNTTIFPKVQDGGMNWGMASNTHVMVTGSYITG